MDSIDKARMLVGGGVGSQKKEGATHSSNVTLLLGVASSDSSDGYVSVDMLGTTVTDEDSDEQAVEIPTTQVVKEGDIVQVALSGADGNAKSLLGIGVIGGGDRSEEELHTIIRDTDDGVEVGKVDSDGNYVGYHALMNSSGSYDIYDASGNLVSRFDNDSVDFVDDKHVTYAQIQAVYNQNRDYYFAGSYEQEDGTKTWYHDPAQLIFPDVKEDVQKTEVMSGGQFISNHPDGSMSAKTEYISSDDAAVAKMSADYEPSASDNDSYSTSSILVGVDASKNPTVELNAYNSNSEATGGGRAGSVKVLTDIFSARTYNGVHLSTQSTSVPLFVYGQCYASEGYSIGSSPILVEKTGTVTTKTWSDMTDPLSYTVETSGYYFVQSDTTAGDGNTVNYLQHDIKLKDGSAGTATRKAFSYYSNGSTDAMHGNSISTILHANSGDTIYAHWWTGVANKKLELRRVIVLLFEG